MNIGLGVGITFRQGLGETINNLIASPNDLQAGNWTTTGGGLINSASEFEFGSASSILRDLIGTVPTGEIYTAKVFISGDTPGDTFEIELVDSADGSDSNRTVVTVSETPTEYTVIADYTGSGTFSGNLGFFFNRLNSNRSITAGSKIYVSNARVY